MDTVQLLPRTRELLANCELSLKEIADGSGLGFEWLKKFKSEADHDFGVNRVQTLHDFLLEHQPTPPKKEGAKRAAAAR